MRAELRYDKLKLPYFSFVFEHHITGKKIRIKKEEAPLFRVRSEAEAWARTQDAQHAALKDAARQRQEWQNKYHSFKDYSDGFIAWKKEKAPNSWQRSVVLIQKYVFHFFLNIQEANNANNWHLYFQHYKDWLARDAIQLLNGGALSVSTQNQAINALNSFLEHMATYNQIAPESAKKCSLHPSHKIPARTFEDVYSDDELEKVEAWLRSKDENTADFFYLISKTGMRFNELYSLPYNALFKGQLPKKEIQDELALHKIEYHGYILLESQIKKDKDTDASSRGRLPDGSHVRGPLKGRKTIEPKNSRFIPIDDVKAWNIFVKLYKIAQTDFEKKKFGDAPINYLMFEYAEINKLRRLIKEAFFELKFPEKDYHCLRHTRSTHLVGRTRSWFLARAILGHKSEKEFERYCHIFAQLQIEAKRNEQTIDFERNPHSELTPT